MNSPLTFSINTWPKKYQFVWSQKYTIFSQHNNLRLCAEYIDCRLLRLRRQEVCVPLPKNELLCALLKHKYTQTLMPKHTNWHTNTHIHKIFWHPNLNWTAGGILSKMNIANWLNYLWLEAFPIEKSVQFHINGCYMITRN